MPSIPSLCLSVLTVLGFYVLPSLQYEIRYHANSQYPNRTIAGIAVINTPLVEAAENYARAENSDVIFRHVMRAWLFGVLIIANNETLQSTVDLEIHAVSSLLHDLGLSRKPNNTIVTLDRRFEVDGAIAARSFIEDYETEQQWDERRLQLVWDAIALHSERSIAYYKELEVQLTSNGTEMDFFGPGLGVSAEQYDSVVDEFPKVDFRNTFNDTLIGLCTSKPTTTYDTWIQPWGERYVANYSTDGKLAIDNLLESPFVEY